MTETFDFVVVGAGSAGAVIVNLVRHWREQGKAVEGRDLLASIYGWLTEGFDTPHLKQAKELLDELA